MTHNNLKDLFFNGKNLELCDELYSKMLDSYNYFTRKYTLNNKEELLYGNINPYELKKEHTSDVIRHILKITKNVKLDANILNLAKCSALFHDLGRFEQFKKYNTFDDSKSEDHAVMSCKILSKNNILKGLNLTTKKALLTSISQHNKLKISSNLDACNKFFVKLLRDADKLSILKYFINNADKINFNFKSSNLSEDIFLKIMNYEAVDKKNINSLADLNAYLLSWVFDINFNETISYLKEKNTLIYFLDFFNSSLKGKSIVNCIENFLDKSIKEIS